MAATVLAGALLAGCGEGADSPSKEDKPSAPSASAPPPPQGPKVLLTVPSAYAADKGWQEELTWLPREYSSRPPVAVAARTGVVAYLTASEDGFRLKARRAATGEDVFTGTVWEPPKSMGELGKGDYADEHAELPGVATAYQDGREYVVLWAHGVAGQDALSTGKEVVRMAVYPADATGDSVTPLREIEVPVKTYGSNSGNALNDLQVEDLGTGLQIRWHGPAVTGNNPHGAVAVDLATGTIEACADACAKGAGQAKTGKGWLVSGFTGGFQVSGVWSNLTAVPPGASAADWTGNDGEFLSTRGGNVLSRWRAPKTGRGITFPVAAVHDTATGKLKASMACEWTSRRARPGTTEPLAAVISPNGRFIADGGLAFDLQRLHGTCLGATADRKGVLVTSLTDAGIAYGRVSDQDDAVVEIDLSKDAGAPKLLPTGTVAPTWALDNVGVFVTPGPTGGLLISVLKQN
ncbi:hypothetical protein ACFWSF_17510 [Streptomyces sp. NPDC058611]|uniref:hypothetical protein n=1 Tax=unclassified Streptomyces TaxID=2593676 RepID=UPI0036649FA5